jgi:monovalent cation/hydrogen antiporter
MNAVCSHLDTIELTDPYRHASKHAHDVSHPIIKSAGPGEDRRWCHMDKVGLVLG